MKIWVIGRNYPTKINNMQGSFELEQACLLYGYGENEVAYLSVVFHPFKKINKWGYCTFRYNNVGIYAYSTVYAPERIRLHLKAYQSRIWENFTKKVESETGTPDIIHVHYPGLITIPEPILRYKNKGTKIVITEHWTKVLNKSIDSFQKKQLKEYVDGADKILCVGYPLKDSIKSITETDRDIEVVPNFVSNMFRPSQNVTDDSLFEFVAIGRLARVKQMDKIVFAFSKAFFGKSNIKLTIIGEGEERSKIEKEIKKGHIEKQVELTGLLSREDTAFRIRQANALICFSNLETFGVPVIEAWACGKPAIASTSLGFMEYWNKDLGMIVDYNDVEGLINAMKDMYKNRRMFCSDRISKFAIENFGERAIYNKLMNIYKD